MRTVLDVFVAPARSLSSRLLAGLYWMVSRVHRPYVRLAVLTSAATAAAWTFGAWLPQVSAVAAAITALVTVRPTFHATIEETVRQVIGVIMGGGLAYAALQSLGFSAFGLFFSVGFAFLVARLLKLGEEGGAAIGVTIILMVSASASAEAIETRLLGVVVGSLMALVVSLVVRPGLPHGRALADTLDAAEKVSDLLSEIASSLVRHDGADVVRTRGWLDRAETILRRVAEIRTEAEAAVEGARWSPLVDRADAQAVVRQVLLTRATAITVVNICRDLHHAAVTNQAWPEELITSISGVLEATADVIVEQTDTARETPAETLSLLEDVVTTSLETQQEASATVRDLDDTQPILLGGSLLRDSAKITNLLSDNPAR